MHRACPGSHSRDHLQSAMGVGGGYANIHIYSSSQHIQLLYQDSPRGSTITLRVLKIQCTLVVLVRVLAVPWHLASPGTLLQWHAKPGRMGQMSMSGQCVSSTPYIPVYSCGDATARRGFRDERSLKACHGTWGCCLLDLASRWAPCEQSMQFSCQWVS